MDTLQILKYVFLFWCICPILIGGFVLIVLYTRPTRILMAGSFGVGIFTFLLLLALLGEIPSTAISWLAYLFFSTLSFLTALFWFHVTTWWNGTTWDAWVKEVRARAQSQSKNSDSIL